MIKCHVSSDPRGPGRMFGGQHVKPFTAIEEALWLSDELLDDGETYSEVSYIYVSIFGISRGK